VKVDTLDCFGKSGLHLALNNNMEQMAQLFIEKGANVGLADEDGDKPLDIACTNGLTAIV